MRRISLVVLAVATLWQGWVYIQQCTQALVIQYAASTIQRVQWKLDGSSAVDGRALLAEKDIDPVIEELEYARAVIADYWKPRGTAQYLIAFCISLTGLGVLLLLEFGPKPLVAAPEPPEKS